MINVKDNFFELQARTKIAKGGGTATVFSGAVAKEHNTSIVQCNLKEEGEKCFDSNKIMIREVNFALNQPAHTIMKRNLSNRPRVAFCSALFPLHSCAIELF